MSMKKAEMEEETEAISSCEEHHMKLKENGGEEKPVKKNRRMKIEGEIEEIKNREKSLCCLLNRELRERESEI